MFIKEIILKIKDGAYVINLDEFKSIGSHWMALYVNGNNIIYFGYFGGEHILTEIKKFIGNKNIIRNTYRIQAYNSIMCRYFCDGFISFMLHYCCWFYITQIHFFLMIMRRMIK